MKDRMAMTKVSEELLAKRRALMEKFTSYRDEREKNWTLTEVKRQKLRDGRDDLSVEEVEEETIEFFTKEETIIVESE